MEIKERVTILEGELSRTLKDLNGFGKRLESVEKNHIDMDKLIDRIVTSQELLAVAQKQFAYELKDLSVVVQKSMTKAIRAILLIGGITIGFLVAAGVDIDMKLLKMFLGI